MLILPARTTRHIAGFVCLPRPERLIRAVRRWQRSWRNGGPLIAFAVRHVGSGELVGGCELRDAGDRTAKLSYWTGTTFRRRGFATRAIRLITAFAFASMQYQRIEVMVDVDNIPSRRAAEKAGFSHEGVLRSRWDSPDGRRDAAVYSLLQMSHDDR